MDRIEFAGSGTLDGNKLVGVAHTYGEQAARPNGRVVKFAKGAFTKALQTSDVRAFYNHDPNYLLGRQSAGTLTLTDEDDGLHYSIDLPATSYAEDLKELVRRGDINGASFGVIPGKAQTVRGKGAVIQTHTEVKGFIDISPVALPAFSGTSVLLNSQDGNRESLKSQITRVRARAKGLIA